MPGAPSTPRFRQSKRRVFGSDAHVTSKGKLAPARKPDPFQMIAKVDFKLPDESAAADSSDQETLHTDAVEKTDGHSQDRDKPDIRPDADAAGHVTNANSKKAAPAATPKKNKDNRNFLQRFFAPKKKSQPTDNQAAPPKRHWPW